MNEVKLVSSEQKSNKGTTLLAVFLFNLTLLSPCAASAQVQFDIKGLIQSQLTLNADDETSYLNRGTGLLRYDDSDKFTLAHTLLQLNADFNGTTSFHATINSVEDPKHHIGFTQLFFKYSPLWSKGYRWRFRTGMFYPEIGFENPDIGWLSPFHYSNSAINSWIGEEVRTLGGEVKVTRLGRAHGFSPHNFSASFALYKGNDTAGTLLAWRGWAIHDRQSLTNERIFFARYPSIGPNSALPLQAAWVEPYREVDGRFGYQFGLHWDYQKQTQVKYLYYNNNGDDSIVARGGQYAWNTLFSSLSLQHKFNAQWRLIAHAMVGKTAMGTGKVEVDFDAWYASLVYRQGPNILSLRYDNYATTDTDYMQLIDNNNGHGWAATATYRRTLNKHWQVGVEWLYVDSFQASRGQWPDISTDITQQQLLAIVQFRF
ncbi:MAG: hypothetical protein ACFHVJ_12260 [Aestuariibacter sp.]